MKWYLDFGHGGSEKANKEKCDYFISIHINASTNKSAKGCEIWVYSKESKVYNLSKTLVNNLSKTMNTPNRGVKFSKDFSVLRKTNMPALLIEVDFISNLTCESYLNSSQNITSIANCISSTLLSYVNKSPNDRLYKVCIGSFKKESNAINMKNNAINKGFKDAFVIQTQ